uniref:Centrosomal protein POC5 n=1 Tax=Neolamprologus brichardi TaxID=32507 RepID=A0A3Q4M757_NEOBR
MSSDEEEPTSPVLPKDSDRGSSVSSELQVNIHSLPVCLRLCFFFPTPAEKMAGHSSSRASLLSDNPSERLQVASERSRPDTPEPFEFVVTEMFISEENINKMENILDTWSNNLKSNVLTELRKWKLAFVEQHKLEMMKERERHAAQTAGLKSELDSLKQLLQTYETSNQRKDEVIGNLSQVLDRQKEKLEKMRAFTHWRLQHIEARSSQVAQQHYNLQLKKKVWFAWQSLIQKHWKVKVERACRSRAEEVCSQMSVEYEAKLAEHCEAIERAQVEIQRLRLERERYEESMKKAFMRGVCALNMEALSMFHSTEGRAEQPPAHDHVAPLPWLSSSHMPPLPHSSVQSILTTQTRRTVKQMMWQVTVGTRVITASQQKSSKTVTARVTARHEISKVGRSSLQVMGVAPPMSSVVVERHHPVTQLTIGQATAAKFPSSSQKGHMSTAGRASSRTHSSTCHTHSIKVVD